MVVMISLTDQDNSKYDPLPIVKYSSSSCNTSGSKLVWNSCRLASTLGGFMLGMRFSVLTHVQLPSPCLYSTSTEAYLPAVEWNFWIEGSSCWETSFEKTLGVIVYLFNGLDGPAIICLILVLALASFSSDTRAGCDRREGQCFAH